MNAGGWSPVGIRPNTYKRIYEALNQSCGTAYDTSPTSNVSIENHAIARAIAEAWATNERLSYIYDPLRCSYNILKRWERICRLYPLSTDTVPARRRRLAAHCLKFGVKPTYQVVTDRLTAELGDVFIAIRHITVADAAAHWAGTAEPDSFTSTVCHILVHTQKLAGSTEGQFYEAVGKSARLLDSGLPSHMTFDWYRNGTLGAGAGMWTSDTDAGFYLDDENNLDNAILDE